MKLLLTRGPILSHPNFDLPFTIQTDSSDEGLGAVLCQYVDGQERVIMYISRTLQPSEKKWTTREKEALCIIWACETLRPYIIGSKFTIETDHESIKWFTNAKVPARLVRWALRMSEFDYEIKHRSGKKNGNADGLSRLPLPDFGDLGELEPYLGNFESNECLNAFFNSLDWTMEQKKDPILANIFKVLASQTNSQLNEKFVIENNILYHLPSKFCKNKTIVVPHKLVVTILGT